jgi:hypothetical protein
MKKSLWAVVSFMLTIALVDLVVFEWWLPQRFLRFLEKEMDSGQLTFEDIKLNWWDGTLIGGKWESSEWSLQLGDGSFSYSSLDWFLGNKLQIKHLELRNLKVRSLNNLNSSGSIFSVFDQLRLNPLNLGCDSIDVNGNFEMGSLSIPFSFFGSQPKSKNEIKSAIEFRMDEGSPLLAGITSISSPLFLKAFINKDLKEGRETLTVSVLANDLFKFEFVNDGELESMKLITKSKNKNIPLGQIQMGRKRGEREFKGDWNGTISSTDLVRYLPTLSLVDAKIKGGGQISFDSVSRLFDLEIIAEFSVSSIFFPKEGLVKGNVQSRIEFIDQNWRIKELNMHIENDDGEKIEVHIDEPIDRSKKLGELNFSLVDFELGRFNQHFSKEAKINGNFKTIITPSFILLDSDNAFYNDSLIEQKHISISIKLPLNLSSNKEAGIKFDFKVLPVVEIFTHLLPPVINQKKQFSLQNLRVTGQVTNSGWIVESSSLEMFNYDMRVGEIKVGNLLLNHKVDKGFEWSSINSPNNLESTFYIENLDTEFSLVIKNLNLIGSFKDLKGKIIFDNGYPQLVCENFIVDGLLTDQNSNILQGVQIKGDLQFDPKSKTYEQFQINKLEVWGDDEELLKGEISLSLKEDAAVVGLKSREIDISLSTVRFFPIPQILNLKNQKIEANKLEWQFSGENELKLDGLIRLTKPDSNEFLNIPVNWTFVEKGEEISHWIQLSFKKDLKSDLEINFQSGSNFVSYRGDRLNIVDLLPVFKSLLRPLSKSKVFDFGNFLNQFDKNAILSLKTLILSPKIKLENFEAKYNNLNKTISFTSLFGESVIDGELNFQSLDGNSSNFSIFKFVINGRETNATILNSIVSGNVLLGGSMNWELGVNGTLGGDYETKCNGDFRNISFNFFSDNKANHTPMLKAEMENSLGNSFSWSATQSKLMEVFVILLRNIRFDNGSFELNRSDSGHWKFSIKDWVSSELNLLGNGELTPQGNFKMNLFPSVKGEWAGFLEVANLLAAGKVRKGYRTLKQEPLVFEGSNQRWNFTNWWNLFAQGIGLEPSE